MLLKHRAQFWRALESETGCPSSAPAAGFTHSAFTFASESLVSRTNIDPNNVPPGSLVTFIQKGLQYLEIEANLDAPVRPLGTASALVAFPAYGCLTLRGILPSEGGRVVVGWSGAGPLEMDWRQLPHATRTRWAPALFGCERRYTAPGCVDAPLTGRGSRRRL